jgi:hypothetical protein
MIISRASSSHNLTTVGRCKISENDEKQATEKRQRGIFIIISCNVAIIGEFINKKPS